MVEKLQVAADTIDPLSGPYDRSAYPLATQQ